MYRARAVTVRYSERTILDRVDCVLLPGRVTVVIGPNGAGKSTLLKVMAGEIRPASGSVHLHDLLVASAAPGVLARHRGVLTQSVQLSFSYPVEEVVRLGLAPTVDARRAETVIARALDVVGLGDLRQRICTTLSGGEQQRIHLARVLAQLWGARDDGKARYLLLDEPTASLDLAHQLLVLRIARDHAAAGGGVLAVLHDLNLAAMIGDQIIALDRGRVSAVGPPEKVITDRLLSEVYGTSLRVSVIPPGIFVLPQTG